MQARTSNPSREQRELENSLLIRCLARTVMERYPNKLHRKQFYDQWSKRHSADSTSRLVSAVKDEYQNFLGWCVLGGFPASHSLLTQYIRATSPVNTLLSARSASDTGVSFSVQPVAPWWSELPHLAPLPVPAGTFV